MAPLILIVDDEISNRRTLTRVLQREGFSIIEAKDGEEALQQLHQNPTLMITDLKMPKVDGMELLTRAREEFPHTEVILMTAFGTIDLAVQAMREGAWEVSFLLESGMGHTLSPFLHFAKGKGSRHSES